MSVKHLKRGVVVGFAAFATAACSTAQAQSLHVLRPISNAIVRETVPIRIAPGDLPAEGYVGITIDGKFRTARVLPANKREAVYDWDTKASYVTPDEPGTQKFVADGPHTVSIKLYDTSGKSLGEQTIDVKVANKISVPTQGIKLAYRWRPDLQQRYTRRTEADTVADGTTGTNQTLQSSIIRFTRTVEDTTGGAYLIRDRILPGGILVSNGQPQSLDALYTIKSKYRTVDTRGNVLGSMAPLSLGDHFGFSIPVLSARRVSVGDTWQAPVDVSLDWASIKPAPINAESRLEGFEWQSGYPAAKIRETYSGPVTFTTANGASSAGSGALPGLGAASGQSSNGSITLSSVNYERIVYIAYNSGRLIRTETTLTLTADNAQLASLGLAAGSGGGGTYNSSRGGGSMGGGGSADNMDTPLPGQGSSSGPQPGSYPGAYPGSYSQQGGPGYPAAQPSSGYSSGPSGGYPGQGVPQSTTTNLKVTDITSQS